MQTFLPYADFAETMRCLDTRRLGKQRVEAMQLIKSLTVPSYGWKNHPASKMWAGYVDALGLYMNHAIDEWIQRGYKNTMSLYFSKNDGLVKYPPWLQDPRIHETHRSNLLRKMPEHYGQFGWTVSPKLEYFWPV